MAQKAKTNMRTASNKHRNNKAPLLDFSVLMILQSNLRYFLFTWASVEICLAVSRKFYDPFLLHCELFEKWPSGDDGSDYDDFSDYGDREHFSRKRKSS